MTIERKYQVGRALSNNALAIIVEGDTVLCMFPGEWNGCTERMDYAQMVCDELNNASELQAERAAVAALVAKWQSQYGHENGDPQLLSGEEAILSRCADELAALAPSALDAAIANAKGEAGES